jgi:hypothetical protein
MVIHEKGIIPILQGGMGNQMFIVAAAYVAHREVGAPLYILENPSENNPHNHKQHNYNSTIFKQFGTHLPFSQEGIKNNPDFSEYKDVGQGVFDPWNPMAVLPGSFMVSFFQYYPTLQRFENDLRTLFLGGLEKPTKDYSSYAFLHIRRGDYLQNSTFHYVQPLAYYEKVSILFPKILVISDDMEWVKQQDLFKENRYELYESDDELETLAVMSACTAGAICANSTFSWWGAFLGAYGKRHPCIVPRKWIDMHVVSLFPPGWIIYQENTL